MGTKLYRIAVTACLMIETLSFSSISKEVIFITCTAYFLFSSRTYKQVACYVNLRYTCKVCTISNCAASCTLKNKACLFGNNTTCRNNLFCGSAKICCSFLCYALYNISRTACRYLKVFVLQIKRGVTVRPYLYLFTILSFICLPRCSCACCCFIIKGCINRNINSCSTLNLQITSSPLIRSRSY